MLKLILPILFIPLFFSVSYSQHNLNGIWKDVNNKNFKNCFLIIAQSGDSVFINHYLEYKGTPMVEYGKGIITKDSVKYEVKVSLSIPGWSNAGVHHLKIINKKQLSGMYFDSLGNSGELFFKKHLPKN